MIATTLFPTVRDSLRLRPGGGSPKSNVAIPLGILTATQKTEVRPEEWVDGVTSTETGRFDRRRGVVIVVTIKGIPCGVQRTGFSCTDARSVLLVMIISMSGKVLCRFCYAGRAVPQRTALTKVNIDATTMTWN